MHTPSPLRNWLSTIPALLVLLFTVAHGTSEILQARLLSLGEQTWPGYAELRFEPEAPTCDPAAIGAPAKADSKDDDLLDDLLGGTPDADAGDEDLLDDLLATPPAEDDDEALLDDLMEQPSAAGGDDEALLDDLLGDEDAGADDADLLDDLLGGSAGGVADAKAQAVAAARAECEREHEAYAALMAQITPTVSAYRAVDTGLAQLTDFGRRVAQPLLVFLILICGATATAFREHIALRPIKSELDNKVAGLVQGIVTFVLALTCAYHYTVLRDSGVDMEYPWLSLLWTAGLLLMSALSVRDVVRPPEGLTPGGSLGHALLTPPLYITMGIIAIVWFIGFEQHPAGISIHLDKLTTFASLYIQVGLYVWAGMLLKRTKLAQLCFDVLRPWKFPPELMAIIVVTASALPTAYSGASGIFVIAAGGVIYTEMRRAGARNQLALASTALSGSLGVVLNPCLLVVIVASLNKQVTTGDLFGAGRWVFLLTAVLFAVVVLVTRQSSLQFAKASEAMPETRAALKRLVPYVATCVGVILGYGLVLNTWMNEHSAPKILLVMLLTMVVVEQMIPASDDSDGNSDSTVETVREATAETTGHIGALLMLMALSVAFGGVVERAEVMSLVPDQIDNVWLAMGMLTTMLVGIGMLMDPYGAVILVSATIAQVAYANGIDPLHFWMVVLVAFELGYLTPPVALNHLLTRAVVGDAADVVDVDPDASFWRRHERYTLPMAVMGTALILVAFGPLLVL